ncbi:efflux RND transporter periplasmic adaptor subunit [Vibrio sp.]|uniref:efflux RND transporter periplasmic adaptor subunit n=1 Tax=Vibrio sp. TaxID=678 RepID=UPI003D09D7C7
MKIKPIIPLLTCLFVVSPAVLAAGNPREERATSVVIEKVQSQQISQSLSLIGKLEAEQSVEIAAESAGIVEVIAVKANQKVKQGQLLVKLNDDKAKAAVVEARAYLTDEQRKLQEFERLVSRNAITQTEINAQKASVEIAQARLDAAIADLNDLHITAPFDGTIGFIDFSRGKLVSAASTLLTLDNLSVMQLDLQVPERYLNKIAEGMQVTAKANAWGARQFVGQVVGIDTRINRETLNLRVRIHFDNTDLALKPGMLVEAQLAFEPISAPIIPVQALQYAGTKRYVYLVSEEKVAQRREVLLGARIGNEVVIDEGLNIGDSIVVQGIVNMRDGVKITPVDEQGRAVGER